MSDHITNSQEQESSSNNIDIIKDDITTWKNVIPIKLGIAYVRMILLNHPNK